MCCKNAPRFVRIVCYCISHNFVSRESHSPTQWRPMGSNGSTAVQLSHNLPRSVACTQTRKELAACKPYGNIVSTEPPLGCLDILPCPQALKIPLAEPLTSSTIQKRNKETLKCHTHTHKALTLTQSPLARASGQNFVQGLDRPTAEVGLA